MLNLGPYTAKEFSGIRIHPTLIDRILEIIAILLAVASWGCAIWVYSQVADKAAANYSLFAAGLGTMLVLLLGASAYLPIGWVRFPVRLTERNAASQYFLAVRVVRVVNAIFALMFLILVFDKVEAEFGLKEGLCTILISIVLSLVIMAFLVYYFFAFKYK